MSAKLLSSGLIITIVCAFGLFLASCNPGSPTNTTHPEMTNLLPPDQPSLLTDDLLYDWLNGEPCMPPCWQGITPEQTLKSQAVYILQSDPELLQMEVITVTDYSLWGGSIYWELKSAPAQSGFIKFGGEPPIVENIGIAQNSRLTLQEVMNVYGEPSHVLAVTSPCVDQDCIVYRFAIVYLEKGFALNLATSAHRKPEFTSNWRGFNVLFFEPTLDGFAQAWGNPAILEAVTPWRGVLAFDDYCMGESC